MDFDFRRFRPSIREAGDHDHQEVNLDHIDESNEMKARSAAREKALSYQTPAAY